MVVQIKVRRFAGHCRTKSNAPSIQAYDERRTMAPNASTPASSSDEEWMEELPPESPLGKLVKSKLGSQPSFIEHLDHRPEFLPDTATRYSMSTDMLPEPKDVMVYRWVCGEDCSRGQNLAVLRVIFSHRDLPTD